MPGSLIQVGTNAKNNNNSNTHESIHDTEDLMESQDSFPLLSLAPEIISSITSQLDQGQILRLRLVCRQLKSLIDELYGFRFNISDELGRLNGNRIILRARRSANGR